MNNGLHFIQGNIKNKKVFILSNYIWFYVPYTWHIKQLKKENINGPIFFINIPELKTSKNYFINLLKNNFLILKQFLSCDIFIIDGHIGIWMYFFTFSGLLKNKFTIAYQQNYTFPKLTLKSIFKYIFLRKYFNNCNYILVNNPTSGEILSLNLGISLKKFVFSPVPINFDSAENYLKPSKKPGKYILACGKENRDYETFIKAIKNYPREVRISTQIEIYKKINLDKNITYIRPTNTISMIDLIRDARILVVPLSSNLNTGGITIIRWGLELGKAIIVTKRNSILEIYGANPPFIYVEANDEIALRNSISELDSDEEKIISLGKIAREWTFNNHTSSAFVNNLWKDYINKVT